MVRFHTHRPLDEADAGNRRGAPNYFSRPQQYRLLVMVFTLLLVLFLMAEAAKPKNWQWMWHLASGTTSSNAATRSDEVGDDVPTDEVVDTRLSLSERTTHPPGVFVAVADPPASREPLAGEETPTNSNEASPKSDGDAAKRESDIPRTDLSAVDNLFPGVTVEQLQTIRDDTVFRRAETEAWFSWCGLLPSAAEIQPQPPRVTFLQLFRQPGEYRGRLVRVAGVVRRAHEVAAQPNDQGVTRFYQCWLFPDEIGGNPIVVYSLTMPDGFPTGMQLHENVEFNGLFFKRWAYEAKGGMMTAPLVLAAGADWTPSPPPPPVRFPTLSWVVAALGLAASFGGTVAWLVYRQSVAPAVSVHGKRRRDLPDEAPVIVNDVRPEK